MVSYSRSRTEKKSGWNTAEVSVSPINESLAKDLHDAYLHNELNQDTLELLDHSYHRPTKTYRIKTRYGPVKNQGSAQSDATKKACLLLDSIERKYRRAGNSNSLPTNPLTITGTQVGPWEGEDGTIMPRTRDGRPHVVTYKFQSVLETDHNGDTVRFE